MGPSPAASGAAVGINQGQLCVTCHRSLELPPAHRAKSLSRAGLMAKPDTGELALLLAAVGLVFLRAGSSPTGGPRVQGLVLVVPASSKVAGALGPRGTAGWERPSTG